MRTAVKARSSWQFLAAGLALAAAGRGRQGHGTVYSLTPDGKETVLYRFAGPTDGIHPTAAPLNIDGKLYGTTDSGGLYNQGTVYRLLSDGTEQVIYSFGALPVFIWHGLWGPWLWDGVFDIALIVGLAARSNDLFFRFVLIMS